MSNQPEPNTRWLHNNGREYSVILLTNLSSDDLNRYPPTVVYKGINGCIWSRPLSDWHRSFTKLRN